MHRFNQLINRCSAKKAFIPSVSIISSNYLRKMYFKRQNKPIVTTNELKYIIRNAQMNGRKDLALDQLNDNVMQSFVRVVVVHNLTVSTTGKTLTSIGSGVALKEATGYVVTNCHVTEEKTTIYIHPYSRDNAGDIREKPFSQTPKGNVVYVEPELDLALVAVSGQLDTNGLELSASADMGQRVVAFGSPDYLHNTIFDGVVFSVDRKYKTISRGNWESFTHFMDPNTTNITHTCAIYAGFSGGPVLDMSGRVVGINWGGIIDYHETFAITSTDVKGFIARGLKFERESQQMKYSMNRNKCLGITVQTLSPRIRNLLQKMPQMSDFALNVTEGVVVMSVVFSPNDEHSSPPMAKKPKLSADAEFMTNDIIIRVNNKPIKSVNDLKECINECKEDDLDVTLRRNKLYKALKIDFKAVDSSLI